MVVTMTDASAELSRHQQALYDVLRREARMGRVLPSNGVLADMAGYQSDGSMQTALEALERKGLIHVEGSRGHKIVMIVATGECTARPPAMQEKTPARIVHGSEPCWRCGSRPDACMCRRRG